MYLINKTMFIPVYLDSYNQPNKYIMRELNQVFLVLASSVSMDKFLQATKHTHTELH